MYKETPRSDNRTGYLIGSGRSTSKYKGKKMILMRRCFFRKKYVKLIRSNG